MPFKTSRDFKVVGQDYFKISSLSDLLTDLWPEIVKEIRDYETPTRFTWKDFEEGLEAYQVDMSNDTILFQATGALAKGYPKGAAWEVSYDSPGRRVLDVMFID